jgi:hypothetical protein
MQTSSLAPGGLKRHEKVCEIIALNYSLDQNKGSPTPRKVTIC